MVLMSRENGIIFAVPYGLVKEAGMAGIRQVDVQIGEGPDKGLARIVPATGNLGGRTWLTPKVDVTSTQARRFSVIPSKLGYVGKSPWEGDMPVVSEVSHQQIQFMLPGQIMPAGK
jgi:hypothetical protein